ncbi:hypothetical protein EDEG_03603 [Edhazardia aedis USNM 41457]|uniref:Uncharacterized protein n=1 Tax=Edhazardia aedis (strain USNM 41457) TaxID=1003232 RepID=J9D2X7_EDHAE|nr:hypothetical protein EDEG_03603 [Edhazardia aedis USNM 41457]|eukprot:EJW01929.1 hypothetical protein EDEG_03603 [Edhazardia aedis USNM 41457]
MSFLEKLFFGKELPLYSEQATYPSTTYKDRCRKKHCTDKCHSDSAEDSNEWKFWAYFLSEKEVSKTVLFGKINTLPTDLVFSVWVKLLGLRDYKVAFKENFLPMKSDKNVVDFVLRFCREESSEEIVGGREIEQSIFRIYRNILDLFLQSEPASQNSQNKICNDNENNEIENNDIESVHSNISESKKTPNLATKDKISSSSNKNSSQKNNKKDNNELEKTTTISAVSEKVKFCNNIFKTTFDMYTSDEIQEELIILINYLLNIPFSTDELVFRVLYIFFDRLGFSEIFSCRVENNSYLIAGLDENIISFLQKLKFTFIRDFLILLIKEDPEKFNCIMNTALCFGPSAFQEILNRIILDCKDAILILKRHFEIQMLEYRSVNAESNDKLGLEEESTKVVQSIIKEKLLDLKENYDKTSRGKESDESRIDDKYSSRIETESNQSQSTLKSLDISFQEGENLIKYVNKKLARILTNFVIAHVPEKLSEYCVLLKQQKINTLLITPQNNLEEKYFDFLVIQNEIAKSEENIKSEMMVKIHKLSEENNQLKIQNLNFKHNIEDMEDQIKNFHNDVSETMKKKLSEVEALNIKLKKENDMLKKKNIK